MAGIKADYVFKSLFIVHVCVVSFTGCLTREKAVEGTSPLTNFVYKTSATKIRARNAPSYKDFTTMAPIQIQNTLYPTVHINKTWNCSDINMKNQKIHHSNSSIYVYYTDSDPYVCNLNPLHCKRPEQPEGIRHQNSLTLYPKYGDYSYLPISQWILLLQHGAVAFLYHPCTSKENIDKLRRIAKKCMRRHIITPYEHLNMTQPIAMVAWASFYATRYVNETASEDWIKNNAMKGPASYILLDGEYKLGLIQPAHVVSDAADSKLCPKERFETTGQEKNIALLSQHYSAIHKHGQSSKKLKKQLIQNLKKQLKPKKRHVDSVQAAWAVGSLLFLCFILVLVLLYTKPWNERDYYLKEKMASRDNNSNFSMLKSHLRHGQRSWRDVAEQQRHAAASRRLLGPIHEEEEEFMGL